jgi:flagellar basal-body rod protein FlgB
MTPLRPVDLGRPFAGLDRLQRHLTHHTDRQGVIAANLANLDTPGYRARDVGMTESLTVVTKGDAVERTLDWDQELVIADDEAPDQDGNTVSLEGQMAKMSSNMLRFQSLAELLSRRVGMLRYAATDGG